MYGIRPDSRHVTMTAANEPCPMWARCGIILSAGEGTRLQPLVRRLRGDALPKQYVRFFGYRSMVEQTALRVRTLIGIDRLYTVVSHDHLAYSEVQELVTRRLLGNVVLQPSNKDTGPGLLLPLTYLTQRHPDSVVAVFPSDHFIADNDLFMAHVNLAYHLVEQNPWLTVLLGVEPGRPEPEYGYILPGAVVERGYPSSARTVLRFVEKPNVDMAEELACQGGMWNTMVMVFRSQMLLRLVAEVRPDLCDRFLRIGRAIGTSGELSVVRRVYEGLSPVNLSAGLLEPLAGRRPSPLAVLRVRGVAWSDWGTERRIVESIQRMEMLGASALTPEVRAALGCHALPQRSVT